MRLPPHSFVQLHRHHITSLHGTLPHHPGTFVPNHAIQELFHLFAAIDTDDQHALQAADLDPALADEHGDAIAAAEGADREERQLLFLLVVEVEQRVGGVVADGVGGGGAGGAGGDVVGHGDAGVDEGEGRGVDEGGEEGAVLREDVEGDGDGRVGEEVGVQIRAEGFRDGDLELLYPPAPGFVSIVDESCIVAL